MFRTKYRYLLILLLATYSLVNILFVVGDRLFDFTVPVPVLFGLLLVVVLGIWELNRLIDHHLDTLYQRFAGKIHPLIVLFILSQLNAMIAAAVALAASYLVLGRELTWNAAHYTLVVAFGFRVNLFLNCVNAIWYFVDRYRVAELRAEQFEKDSIEAQFEALRNQINPHFLFNCLNALSNLVYKDADTSARFIAQLSNVYRYLLYSQERKIVSLQAEIDFIDSYLFLLKIRFGDNLSIVKRIATDVYKFHIAPATLQMLIENAIKHNIVSGKAPLRINITAVDGSISVSNNLQEKHIKEPSARVGLKNIQKRYEFLSGKPVEIKKTDNEFIVTVPLVEVDPS
ncbi:sensor histidine kinase [Parachryseolinea silvisoli]|uniref:sensor histidine kinase n=1 Tax=Parachryseolinea silvisoli TaxID=2873601 RepID=UPI002265B880|nr:histidine kinase [Parachryseolinea silvisoli]MCD9016674.1 histidine kinase [Parachryseolinea silvisoli]